MTFGIAQLRAVRCCRPLTVTSRQYSNAMSNSTLTKLHGRAFYESIGSPKMIVAPMVDRSEFAWRLLTRSYLDESRQHSLLAYTPMLHARMFGQQEKIRNEHFQPHRDSLQSKERSNETAWLDGNPEIDRPLFVQFCANKPEELFEAAQYVAPYCDAVDLNLGCPQHIAKSGKYGAFLQEDWDTIHALINKLHNELSVPVTAKMRILDTREKTLEYAKMILSAGASILTVHGRRREQKGHNTGVADWSMIRFLRENLPADTVLFANGNILNAGDVQRCLDATGADGVMSAEGNLSDPTIFASPPSSIEDREYWHGRDGIGGFRVDGVFRRYLDIIYRYVLEQNPPDRPPLYLPGDVHPCETPKQQIRNIAAVPNGTPNAWKRKRDNPAQASPNMRFMQGHLFQLLRTLITIHTDIRAALARCRTGDMFAFENVLSMVEEAVAVGLDADAAHHKHHGLTISPSLTNGSATEEAEGAISKYRRPWWVCQPNIRPLPEQALEKGSMQLSKKEKARLESETQAKTQESKIEAERHEPANEGNMDFSREAMVCG